MKILRGLFSIGKRLRELEQAVLAMRAAVEVLNDRKQPEKKSKPE